MLFFMSHMFSLFLSFNLHTTLPLSLSSVTLLYFDVFPLWPFQEWSYYWNFTVQTFIEHPILYLFSDDGVSL